MPIYKSAGETVGGEVLPQSHMSARLMLKHPEMALVPKSTSTKGRLPTGYAEEIAISEFSFRSAHRAVETNSGPASKKRKREGKGDTSVVYGDEAYKGPWAKYEEERPDASSGSEEEVEVEYEEDEIASQPVAPTKAGTAYEETGNAKETTEFHGSEQYDYQGRTYMHIPQDLDIDLRGDISGLKNYAPKKLIHTYKSHTKSITQLRFFPSAGHLLLSASADSKVKLWDVYHQRELLRTYSGHTKSVVDVDFNYDGTHFLSGSYDRQMKLWDTETGACISRFSTGATPHCIRFNPSLDAAHEFLAGMSDKKIVQFDTRTPGESPVQEYDHHLGPVNTVTFCDENRRFITTSDDKSLRAWEYGIPVPIKFIAEPYMYPLVRSSPHPSGKYVAFQSSDNQIVVYASTERFRQNRKKGFRGHNNAGYAIDVAISPDGGLVMSGDSGGYVCFWDWKTCKMWHKIKASDGAVVAAMWHPRESSKVVTGALDGVIKYWD
ncbi:hypothetical protein LTR66_004597 [Elasticomyces elasticus]|nr:hypothetical protein LTR66_004597 [Elasticomyces elasticus]